SYNSVKNNIAWGHETFRLKRNTFVKIKVRGKTVNIYFAVDCSLLNEKYHAKNLNKEGKTVPLSTLLKVKSDRSVKYAKEIIDLIMNNFGVIKSETLEKVDYTYSYKSTEELLKSGKVKLSKSSK
ncbi:MAG: hypothetical protein KBS91_02460, partial [Firmicutes bacterium]|nr:hypothetical protein [Candidatus Caballimonas caccae]